MSPQDNVKPPGGFEDSSDAESSHYSDTQKSTESKEAQEKEAEEELEEPEEVKEQPEEEEEPEKEKEIEAKEESQVEPAEEEDEEHSVEPKPEETEETEDAKSAHSTESGQFLLAEELPPRTFISSSIRTDMNGSPPPSGVASLLLEAKQSEISIKFGSKDAAQQGAINSGANSIKKTFNNIKTTIGHMLPELLGGEPIDWDFWSRVVENYDGVVQADPESLQNAVAQGIPKEFRGIIWQLVARSKNLQLEELYMHLKSETLIHERAIRRDLTRTSFFTNVDALNKAEELYNVIRAYSLFDPDVGYTQGMVFIAVPLIMNMTEAECFCLLVVLMKEYGLRELFAPDMHGLHLLLHQFDRLLDQNSPLLYNHLVRQGIKSLMYASQWFLTFFSYKFPLDVVLRIFDLVITLGIEGVLRLAVNLMLQNESVLLRLNFDSLLEFLKSNLFNVYVSDEYVASPEKLEARTFSLLRKNSTPMATSYYKLDAFVQDALQVPLSPSDLLKFKLEFELMCNKDVARVEEIESLKVSNGALRHEIKELEGEFFKLNNDHLGVVQSLVDTKVLLPEVLGDIEELKDTVSSLQGEVTELESKLESGPEGLPQDIESQIQDLLAENARETERFANLEEQFENLNLELETLQNEIKQRSGKKWFW